MEILELINNYAAQPTKSFVQEHPYITTAVIAAGASTAIIPSVTLSGVAMGISAIQITATFVIAHPFVSAFASVPITFGIGISLLGLDETTEIAKECAIQSFTFDVESAVIYNLLFGYPLVSVGVTAPFFFSSCMAGEIGYESCDSSDLSRTVCSIAARGVVGGSKYIAMVSVEKPILRSIDFGKGFINNGGYALVGSIAKTSNSTAVHIFGTFSGIPIEFFDVVVEGTFKGDLIGNIKKSGGEALFGGALVTFLIETLYAKAKGNNILPTFRSGELNVEESNLTIGSDAEKPSDAEL